MERGRDGHTTGDGSMILALEEGLRKVTRERNRPGVEQL
jgi:hypothetical protein